MSQTTQTQVVRRRHFWSFPSGDPAPMPTIFEVPETGDTKTDLFWASTAAAGASIAVPAADGPPAAHLATAAKPAEENDSEALRRSACCVACAEDFIVYGLRNEGDMPLPLSTGCDIAHDVPCTNCNRHGRRQCQPLDKRSRETLRRLLRGVQDGSLTPRMQPDALRQLQDVMLSKRPALRRLCSVHPNYCNGHSTNFTASAQFFYNGRL